MPSGPSDCESGIADSLGSAEEAELDSVVLKMVPDGVGRECGSGGPPSTAGKRPKRVKKVVNGNTPHATPQTGPGDLLTAAVAGYLGSLAQDAPKATATSAPPPMSGSVELAISVIESNADERAKAFANQMLMEAMRKQAEDDGIVIVD
jgi:hypothetical protein